MDDDEYAAWVRGTWDGLVRSAVFLGCGLAEAEDLVQTVLVRCYTAWDRVSAADDRSAYVYRMLVNALRDSRRRRWWGERPTEHLPQPAGASPDPTAAVDLADAVHRALADLAPPQRDVVVLRYFAGLSEAQTAAALGVPAGTVKSRLSRALARLSLSAHLAPDPADLSDLSDVTDHGGAP